MARPVPAADGESRIRASKEPFACLPRSIRLGGGEPGRVPASCVWMGSGVRAGLSPTLHMEGASGKRRRGGRGSPQGFSSRAQTCWGQPVRPFSFFSPWPKGCE